MTKRCYKHHLDYVGSDCPTCAADARTKSVITAADQRQERQLVADRDRHREVLEATRAREDREQDDAWDRQQDATAERGREEKRHRESEYLRANPGDYKCPSCLFVSLKRLARRCPLCHGEVSGRYWDNVCNAEAADERRKRAEAEEFDARRVAARGAQAAFAVTREREALAQAEAARRAGVETEVGALEAGLAAEEQSLAHTLRFRWVEVLAGCVALLLVWHFPWLATKIVVGTGVMGFFIRGLHDAVLVRPSQAFWCALFLPQRAKMASLQASLVKLRAQLA